MALRADACGDKGRADVARRGGRACEGVFVVEATSRAASAPLRCRAGPTPPIESVVVFTSVVVVLPSWRWRRWSTFSWFLPGDAEHLCSFRCGHYLKMLADPDLMLFVDGATHGRCFRRGTPTVKEAALNVNRQIMMGT